MYRCSAASSLALAAALVTAPLSAQEVRGPESPASTTTAPSAAAASEAAASAVGTEAPQGLGDIVVTARKVAENQQRVPVAITALSGAVMQQASLSTVTDVAKLTPGLVVNQSASTASAPLFTIRGQVQTDSLATLDPSVGVYVDGYYWARAYGLSADLVDIDSFQTLKGPQGTLFGRNTTGGAILIQTNDPSFRDGISVLASGTYGRFNQWSGTGIVNLPIIDDKLAVRVAYQRNDRDGYMTNDLTGTKLGGQHDYTVRGKLLWKPTDNLSILLSAEQYRAKYQATGFRELYIQPSTSELPAPPAALEIGAETLGAGCFADVGACIAAGSAAGNAAAAKANSGDHVSLNANPFTFTKTQTYTAAVTLDTFFGALKAIGGYRTIDQISDEDLDGSQYNLLATRGFQHLSQYSVEAQATGKAFDGKVDFAAGVFYFREYGTDASFSTALNVLSTLPVETRPSVQFISGDIKNDSQGLYGQSTYHATDKLSFTGGIRYSVDDKRLMASNGTYSSGTYFAADPNATFTCALTTCPDERHASFSGISWTAGADYQLSRTILLYAKASRGFRSGGQNLRGVPLPGFFGATAAFKPEKATSYEGGIKSEFLDHKLRVNLAGYYTVVDDIQRSGLVFAPDGQSATIISNAGQATFYGGEAEASALLPGGFRLDGTFAYTHPKYDRYLAPDTDFSRAHERFADVSKITASISPSWSQDFGPAHFMLRGDFSYQSKTALYNDGYYTEGGVTYDASNPDANGNPVPVDPAVAKAILKNTTDPAHWLINARASVSLDEDRYELAVWGKNLGNKRDLVVALPITALGEVAGERREPRTVGVTATIKFKHL
jgi:iron complex outermembrane receptor protein